MSGGSGASVWWQLEFPQRYSCRHHGNERTAPSERPPTVPATSTVVQLARTMLLCSEALLLGVFAAQPAKLSNQKSAQKVVCASVNSPLSPTSTQRRWAYFSPFLWAARSLLSLACMLCLRFAGGRGQRGGKPGGGVIWGSPSRGHRSKRQPIDTLWQHLE